MGMILDTQSTWQGYEEIAKNYEKGRPDYPQEAVLILAKALKLEAGTKVLDLAAGTGKLAKTLHFLASHPATQGKTILQIPYRAEIYWCKRQ